MSESTTNGTAQVASGDVEMKEEAQTGIEVRDLDINSACACACAEKNSFLSILSLKPPIPRTLSLPRPTPSISHRHNPPLHHSRILLQAPQQPLKCLQHKQHLRAGRRLLRILENWFPTEDPRGNT